MMRAIVGKLLDGLTLVGSLGFLVAVAVTLADVAGRLLGMSIIRGAIDIVGIAMVLAGALAIAKTEWISANIRVELLSGWMPLAIRGTIDRFWQLASAVLLGLVAWYSLQESLRSAGYGEVLPALGWSVLVPGAILCFGFAVGAVVALAAALRRRAR